MDNTCYEIWNDVTAYSYRVYMRNRNIKCLLNMKGKDNNTRLMRYAGKGISLVEYRWEDDKWIKI